MVERYQPNRRDGGDGRRDDPPPRERGGGGGGGRSSGNKWRYEPQRADAIHERANRTGGRFDSIFKSGFDTWRPKAGDNIIRFLPGTWGLGVHYAFDAWSHRYVGADDSTYLCLDKMLGKHCPICDAAAEAKRAKDEDEAKALRAVEQRIAWILDRDGDNKLVPSLFVMSWTMDRDILSLTEDKRRKEQLWIDNPTDGYDVTIKRAGTGLNTRYFGMAIDRSPSMIAEKDRDVDKIMDFVEANPIPEILNYYDAEYIERVLSGTSGPREDEPAPATRDRDRDVAPRDGERGRERDPEPERDRPARGRRDDPEPAREPAREPEREPRRGRREEPEPETARDDDRPARGGRDPEPERDRDPDDRPARRAARDEVRDEKDDDRGGRDRREPDDAPSRRGGRDRDPEPERDGDRRSTRGGNSRDDADDPPSERRSRAEEDSDSRPRRAPRDDPEPRGRGRDVPDEDQRPSRRR